MKTFLANKSSTSTIIALATTLIGVLFQAELIKTIGFFALSGAITNWLAVYMLFEKIPFLYGSGVIPERFEQFKASIRQLMMQQFFTVATIEQFIETEEQQGSVLLNMQPLLNAVDYDKLYVGLVASIMESSFGSMLLMMGGEDALAPLKVPFTEKMQVILLELTRSETFITALQQGLNAHKISSDIVNNIETLIDKRLNELTPQLVKAMVQAIIREHLAWLVVWGGVFGGVMGIIFEFFA